MTVNDRTSEPINVKPVKVTAEQRAAEVEERKDMEAAVSTLTEEERKQLIQGLNVRDRLMRRLKSNTVKIPFKDDLGDFTIEARLLSPDEQKTVGDYRLQLLKFKDELKNAPSDIKEIQKLEKRGTEIVQSIYQLVAEVCVDKSLDLTYWRGGRGFNIDVPMRIINDVLIASQPTEADVAKFRRERTRPGVLRVPSPHREDAHRVRGT